MAKQRLFKSEPSPRHYGNKISCIKPQKIKMSLRAILLFYQWIEHPKVISLKDPWDTLSTIDPNVLRLGFEVTTGMSVVELLRLVAKGTVHHHTTLPRRKLKFLCSSLVFKLFARDLIRKLPSWQKATNKKIVWSWLRNTAGRAPIRADHAQTFLYSWSCNFLVTATVSTMFQEQRLTL